MSFSMESRLGEICLRPDKLSVLAISSALLRKSVEKSVTRNSASPCKRVWHWHWADAQTSVRVLLCGIFRLKRSSTYSGVRPFRWFGISRKQIFYLTLDGAAHVSG